MATLQRGAASESRSRSRFASARRLHRGCVTGAFVALSASAPSSASASTAHALASHQTDLLVAHDTNASYTDPNPCSASVRGGHASSEVSDDYGSSTITVTMTVGAAPIRTLIPSGKKVFQGRESSGRSRSMEPSSTKPLATTTRAKQTFLATSRPLRALACAVQAKAWSPNTTHLRADIPSLSRRRASVVQTPFRFPPSTTTWQMQ